MSKIKVFTGAAETDAQFVKRVSAEARRKILKKSKPINLEALKRSMSIEEPTHLGKLASVRVLVDS